jgi:hypothetical protein
MSLVGTVNALTIYNKTNATVSFYFRWKPSSPWQLRTLAPGKGQKFWSATDTDLEVRFDHSYSPGYQNKQYRLTTLPTPENPWGGAPSGTGQVYNFKPVSGGLNLFRQA